MGRNDEVTTRTDADTRPKVRVNIPAGATKKAPAKKVASKKAAARSEMPEGRAVGGTVGLAAVCRTSGCKNQGARQTFRVPSLGNIALLPGGVVCLVCEKQMRFDLDDVVVERVEGDR